MRLTNHLFIIALGCATLSPGYAAVVWDESVNGDFSNTGIRDLNNGNLGPTPVSLSLGSNQILGTTGFSGIADRDYFTITLPAGMHLDSITLLPVTTIPMGGAGFIGLQAGDQVTLPTNTQTAAGLLGWTHYMNEDIGGNILDDMAVPNRFGSGSSGFTIPLDAGTYAFWVQDTSNGVWSYGFDLNVSSVPLPAAYIFMLTGLGVLGLARRRRSALQAAL